MWQRIKRLVSLVGIQVCVLINLLGGHKRKITLLGSHSGLVVNGNRGTLSYEEVSDTG